MKGILIPVLTIWGFNQGDLEELPSNSVVIRPATAQDVPAIVTMVNRFAAQNIMLPRTEASVQQTLADWLVAVDLGKKEETTTVSGQQAETLAVSAEEQATEGAGMIAGCGSLVP